MEEEQGKQFGFSKRGSYSGNRYIFFTPSPTIRLRAVVDTFLSNLESRTSPVDTSDLQTHLDALRTLSAHLWFKVGVSKSFHQVIPADLPHLSVTETTCTAWTSCDHFLRILFCELTPRCLTERTFHSQTQVMSATLRLLWPEALFQQWI